MKSSKKVRVMCVDDEPQVLQGLKLHLARLYDVQTAADGLEALAQLQACPDVAVIVSDMRMPGMSGAEFLSKSLSITPDAQRILLTGQTDLASAIAAVNEGRISGFLTKPCPPNEMLAAVAEAVERFRARDLERSAVRRGVEFQQLQRDPLTGLGSRQALLGELEAAAFDASESAHRRAALFIEIDASDEPAGEREQPWGDEVAQVIAERLREHSPPDAHIARWGSEQFVVLVQSENLTDDDLMALGRGLLAALTAPIPVSPHPARVGAAIGIARLTERMHWHRLMQRAAAAAREARAGMNVCLHCEDAPPSAARQRDVLLALRQALARNELTLEYQPVIDLESGEVRSLEALVRWRHDVWGDMPPSTFIPLLEQGDDIVDLGRWVLETACSEAPEAVKAGRVALSVNASPRELLDDGFIAHLEKCLASSGVPAQALELELTETALATDVERLRSVLETVRGLGVRIAVDDFGTGYSSLSYLNRLPIDTLKVDKVFVQDFHRGGRTIIKAAMAVAEDFGQELIVEGIETDDHLRQIRLLGISLVQGFYFARPMPTGDVERWLDTTAKSLPATIAGR